MAIKNTIMLAALLLPGAVSGQEAGGITALSALGREGLRTEAAAAVPPAGAPAYAFGLDQASLDPAGFFGALRGEALADPARFIDEHTPAEVGFAFGLDASRARIIDPARIENSAVRITVDLTAQRAHVRAPGVDRTFKISSGLPPHGTPGSGRCYAPDFLEEMHYSSLYNMAPMPHSIFFNGNIAMHATGAEQLLGRPASHGCIRLSKADAGTVYDIVKANGKANTAICVTGATPKL